MQERYLGDSHDYAKYALLRHLSGALSARIGLNWYLTHSALVDKAGNNDGEKRHHFASRKWAGWEGELLEQLAPLQLFADRQLSNFYQLGILPSETVYFDVPVATSDRSVWHQSARSALSGADLIFIDPDNGFEVLSMTQRTKPKYALYSEVTDFLSDNKIVVAIQFARQCDPALRALAVRQRLSLLVGRDIRIPVIRARMAPNLLFVTIAPEGLEASVAGVITAFASGRDKIELIT